jgi:ferric-dicitrate binding protein FerR (iron transport regulator)
VERAVSSDLTPTYGNELDFDALALMHLDGLLDPVQHEDFNRQIASDPAKATRLAIIAELHASLGELGRTSMTQPSPRKTSSVSTRSSRRIRRGHLRLGSRRVPAWGIAAAAVLAVGVTIGVAVSSWSNNNADLLSITQGSVTLERKGTRMRLSNGSMPLRAGDRILTSASSNAHISTGQGDQMSLTGGTHLAWASDGAAVNLHAGSFTADITPRPVNAPFLISTPKANLVVVGTRFTVQADDALSLLAVDHGRVRLTNRDDTRQVEVAANQLTVTTGTGELAATVGSLPATATTGLTGDYFDNQDFTNWRLRRVDSNIDFDWGTRGPDPRIDYQTFSVRWRGWLVPEYTGTYTFTILMDDGVRLWLDGKLIFDEWHLSEKLEFSTTVTLEAGRAYALRLDYYQQPRDAVIRWFWSNSEHPKQPVPTSWLRPLDWTPPSN